MRDEWYIPDLRDSNKIGTHNAIMHRETGELGLFSRRGQIWLSNDTTIGVLIQSAYVANIYLPKDQGMVMPGDEIVIKVPLSEIDVWVERLDIKKNRTSMVRMANEPDTI